MDTFSSLCLQDQMFLATEILLWMSYILNLEKREAISRFRLISLLTNARQCIHPHNWALNKMHLLKKDVTITIDNLMNVAALIS